MRSSPDHPRGPDESVVVRRFRLMRLYGRLVGGQSRQTEQERACEARDDREADQHTAA